MSKATVHRSQLVADYAAPSFFTGAGDALSALGLAPRKPFLNPAPTSGRERRFGPDCSDVSEFERLRTASVYGFGDASPGPKWIAVV